MGKIIGKSALCFVGLCVTSWLIQNLCDWMLKLYPKPLLFGLIWVFILEFIFWLLLPLAFSYLLFLLFRNGKHCSLIIMLNGVFVILQYYLLLMLPVEHDIILASLQASKVAGIPVILLAFMFGNIMTKNKKETVQNKDEKQRILNILAKSTLSFLVLAFGTLGFSLVISLPYSTFGYLGFFIEDPLCIWPLIAITYAYLLFKLTIRHPHRLWIILTNSILLLALSGITILTPSFLSSLPEFLGSFKFSVAGIAGNTAIITIPLAFMFHGVEKHSHLQTGEAKML